MRSDTAVTYVLGPPGQYHGIKVAAKTDTFALRMGQCIIDEMHTSDTTAHGHIQHNLRCAVKVFKRVEEQIGLPRNFLMKKLMQRVDGCLGFYSPPKEPNLRQARMHDMLITLPTTVYNLFLQVTRLGDKKDAGGSSPMVDATNVQHMGLLLPYLFHDLAKDEVDTYNKGKTAEDSEAD